MSSVKIHESKFFELKFSPRGFSSNYIYILNLKFSFHSVSFDLSLFQLLKAMPKANLCKILRGNRYTEGV
jgi:hypothetical protein